MKFGRKKAGCAMVTAVGLLLLLLPAQAVAKTRTVTGKVLASDGEALRGAVVQIKDTRTLHIRSFISEADGSYHFMGVNSDVDHELWARYRGRSSPKKMVSQFDSKDIVQIDLIIPAEPRP